MKPINFWLQRTQSESHLMGGSNNLLIYNYLVGHYLWAVVRVERILIAKPQINFMHRAYHSMSCFLRHQSMGQHNNNDSSNNNGNDNGNSKSDSDDNNNNNNNNDNDNGNGNDNGNVK